MLPTPSARQPRPPQLHVHFQNQKFSVINTNGIINSLILSNVDQILSILNTNRPMYSLYRSRRDYRTLSGSKQHCCIHSAPLARTGSRMSCDTRATGALVRGRTSVRRRIRGGWHAPWIRSDRAYSTVHLYQSVQIRSRRDSNR
jgi:hypothetical protein